MASPIAIKLRPNKFNTMKPKFFISLMTLVLLVGSTMVMGQDKNQKKVDRLMRKIEKQNQKLRELRGNEYHTYMVAPFVMDRREIERNRENARATAENSREMARAAMEGQRAAMEGQREAMMVQRDVMRGQEKALRDKMMVLHEKDLAGLGKLKENKTPEWTSEDGAITVLGDIGDVNVEVPKYRGGVYSVFSGNQDNLSINKNLEDETSSADFNYDVKEGASGMSVNVKGAIDAGKVMITIKRPNGEVFNEYTLSSLGNVNYNQSLKFEDQEESAYAGKWTVTISAEKAKGNYGVSIRER